MVFTLYKDGSLLKTSLLDVYNCLCYPISTTLRPSVECPGGGGGGGGTFYPRGGTVCPSAECPGGHCPLVQNVRGDILHGGTIRPPTPVHFGSSNSVVKLRIVVLHWCLQ